MNKIKKVKRREGKMNGVIEVVVEDKESGNRIIVGYFKKPISLSDCFPRDFAQELFSFLLKKAGKLMGRKKIFGASNFFPQLLNEKPFIRVLKKVDLE